MADLIRSSDEIAVFGALIAGVMFTALSGVADVPRPAPPVEEPRYEAVWIGAPPRPEEPPEPEPPAAPVVEAPAPAEPEVVAVAEAPAVGVRPKLEPRRARPPRKPRGCAVPPDPLIVARGDHVEVHQDVIQRYTRDWAALDALGWARGHDGPDGRPDGLQVGGFRCGSDPFDAGFRSGDVIHAVNGRRVHNLLQAAVVYARVSGDDDYTVEISRGGVRQTLRFVLVRGS